MDEDERKRIMEAPPKGAWALMVIVAAAMVVTWLFLYFGVFISRGVVN